MSSPCPSVPDGLAASPAYSVNNAGKIGWDFGDVNALDESLGHTVLKTSLTEVQLACLRDDVTPHSSGVDIAGSGIGRVTATNIGDVLCNDLLRRTAKVSRLHMSYDHLVAQLSCVTADCNTLRSFAQKCDTDAIDLRVSLPIAKDELNFLNGQIEFV